MGSQKEVDITISQLVARVVSLECKLDKITQIVQGLLLTLSERLEDSEEIMELLQPLKLKLAVLNRDGFL